MGVGNEKKKLSGYAVGAGPPELLVSSVSNSREWGTSRLPLQVRAGPQASRGVAEGRWSSLTPWMLEGKVLGGVIQPAQAWSLGMLQAMAIASRGIPTHTSSFALVTD